MWIAAQDVNVSTFHLILSAVILRTNHKYPKRDFHKIFSWDEGEGASNSKMMFRRKKSKQVLGEFIRIYSGEKVNQPNWDEVLRDPSVATNNLANQASSLSSPIPGLIGQLHLLRAEMSHVPEAMRVLQASLHPGLLQQFGTHQIHKAKSVGQIREIFKLDSKQFRSVKVPLGMSFSWIFAQTPTVLTKNGKIVWTHCFFLMLVLTFVVLLTSCCDMFSAKIFQLSVVHCPFGTTTRAFSFQQTLNNEYFQTSLSTASGITRISVLFKINRNKAGNNSVKQSNEKQQVCDSLEPHSSVEDAAAPQLYILIKKHGTILSERGSPTPSVLL